MQGATITRFHRDPMGTIAKVRTNDRGFGCFSIELSRGGNQPEVSCLPEGTYLVVWSLSPRFRKWTYEIIEPFPHRAGFRIHSGNFAGDVDDGWITHSLGCPIFGRYPGWLRMPGKKPQRAVLVSGPTMRAFENYMQRKPFELTIVNRIQNV